MFGRSYRQARETIKQLIGACVRLREHLPWRRIAALRVREEHCKAMIGQMSKRQAQLGRSLSGRKEEIIRAVAERDDAKRALTKARKEKKSLEELLATRESEIKTFQAAFDIIQGLEAMRNGKPDNG